jgi:hypothetical protein
MPEHFIQSPLGSWQAKNWDPAVGSTNFDKFCNALVGPKAHGLGEVNYSSAGDLRMLSEVDADSVQTWKEVFESTDIHFALFNYARYVRKVGDSLSIPV